MLADIYRHHIGTHELAHLEIIGSIVGQLTDGEGAKSFDKYGNAAYYVDHANAVYPASAAGVPFTAAYLQSKADPIADLVENLAADGAALQKQQNPDGRLGCHKEVFGCVVFTTQPFSFCRSPSYRQ